MVRSAVAENVNFGPASEEHDSAATAPGKATERLARALGEMECRVADVLEEIRRHRRLTRLIVTRDLGFEPTAEVLHAIVRISSVDDVGDELHGIPVDSWRWPRWRISWLATCWTPAARSQRACTWEA